MQWRTYPLILAPILWHSAFAATSDKHTHSRRCSAVWTLREQLSSHSISMQCTGCFFNGPNVPCDFTMSIGLGCPSECMFKHFTLESNHQIKGWLHQRSMTQSQCLLTQQTARSKCPPQLPLAHNHCPQSIHVNYCCDIHNDAFVHLLIIPIPNEYTRSRRCPFLKRTCLEKCSHAVDSLRQVPDTAGKGELECLTSVAALDVAVSALRGPTCTMQMAVENISGLWSVSRELTWRGNHFVLPNNKCQTYPWCVSRFPEEIAKQIRKSNRTCYWMQAVAEA